MKGVLDIIGQIFWLIILTMFFGLIGAVANQVEGNSSIAVKQTTVTKAQETLKLKNIAGPNSDQSMSAEPTKPPKTTSAPSLVTLVLGVMDDLAKLQKPYWPYRQGIDCAVQKCVALTFDDGPSASTSALLDILKSKNVVATFFVTGYNIDTHKIELKRMIAEDNEIGNHGFGHKNYKKLSTPAVTNEVNAVQDAVFTVTGYRPHIHRPPYGEFRPGEPVLNNAPIIFWNNDPDDWKNRNPDAIGANVMAPIKPGSIVVMHDLYPTTISAVPKIIDDLQSQGYTLVTITELFGWEDSATPLPNGQLLRGR